MELRDYQNIIKAKAADLIKSKGICYLAMECRTGKTLTALATAQHYGASHVLFVTKIKAIPSVMNDYQALNPDYEITIINYESVHNVSGKFDFVILDEAHCLGAYPKPSARQEQIRSIAHKLPILFLSGTPSPEGYSQLYHQLQVSDKSPWAAYSNFYKWAKVFVNIKQRMLNGRISNDYSSAREEAIKRDFEPLVLTYTQEQAGFTANIIETDLTIPMAPAVQKSIDILRRDKVVQTSKGMIVGDTPANLLNKLHQLSGGTFINDEGMHIVFDKSKAEYIRDKFKGLKIAIFYCYQSEGDLLNSIFPNHTDNPEDFQQSNDKTFICQVRKAREGVRLDTADALIFYSCEYSYLSYEQARNRLVSKERKEPARVYYCIGLGGIDNLILRAVRSKQDFTLSYYGKQYR